MGALASQARGDLAGATGHLKEGLALAAEAGDETSAAYYLEVLAAVAGQQNNPQRAVRLLAALTGRPARRFSTTRMPVQMRSGSSLFLVGQLIGSRRGVQLPGRRRRCQAWPQAIAGRPRRYIHSMCRPNARKATTTPAATAAGSGTPAVSSSNAVPTPASMLVTAAIMLAPVKSISVTPERIPVLASAASAPASWAEAKKAAAAGSRVA